MVDLREIEEVADKFNNDLELIARELKRIQSVKCRLKRQKGKSDYQEKMTSTLAYEEVLKEARNLISPKSKPVTEYTQEDINELDYDETVKAIRSIQSKKTLTRWLTGIEGDNDEYKSACKIEEMLIVHRQSVKPVDELHVRKSDIETIINTLEESGKLSKDKVIELLKSLIA